MRIYRTTDPLPRRTDIKQHWFTESGRIFYRDGMILREWREWRKDEESKARRQATPSQGKQVKAL
jgi:hypothetical protein